MNAPETIHPKGEHFGMAAEVYHAIEAMSNSALGDLKRSPWHYANRVRRAPTLAMKAGTLAHCAILEPDALAQRYAVKPAGLDGRTKEGKAWAEACAGLDVITADEHANATAQRAAFNAVPELAALLASGHSEVSIFWTDLATGIYCKARPDWVHTLADGRVILLDLKTATDESPTGFARSVANFGYHRQAAHYTDGYTLATGREVAAFVFAAVSAAPPHLAVPYMLDDRAKDAGRAQRDELLARYAACLAANEWPAYGPGVQVLTLPAWAN